MPLFDKVNVSFPDGRKLSISVGGGKPSGTPAHALNGKRETHPFVSRNALSSGGSLEFLP